MKKIPKLAFAVSAGVFFVAASVFIGGRNLSAEPADAAFRAAVGDALAEIASPADTANVDAEVKSLSDFMEYRSGISISPHRRKNLAAQETRFRNGEQPGIPSSEFGVILSDLIIERVSKWSDKEIQYAVENWRGFDHIDLPAAYQLGRSKVRLNGAHTYLTPENLTTILEDIRERRQNSVHSAVFRQEIVRQTNELRDLLTEIDAARFASADSGLSPLHATLIAYSIVANDNLAHSRPNLERYMAAITEFGIREYGNFPDSREHTAYGPNGFLFSSPTDILFDSTGIDILLDKLENRGGAE
jgi:hypothetical protein